MGYPIELQAITNWLAGKADSLAGTGVILVETATRSDHKPAARADFDSVSTIGRISFWVSGEVDFEVLDRADGASLLFRHETVETLDSCQLEEAYVAFIEAMRGGRNRVDDQNPQSSR